MRAPSLRVACVSILLLAVAGLGGSQAPAPPEAASQTQGVGDTYEIRLEGGDLSLSGLHVLRTLSHAKMLRVTDTTLTKGEHESVCSVFIEGTNLPGGCTQGLIDFATRLNRFKESPTRLAEGTKVFYPKAEFEKYEYEKQYNLSTAEDRNELADDRRKAGQYMSPESTKSRSGRFIEYTFEAYKLKLTLPKGQSSEDLIRKLNAYPGVFVVKEPSSAQEKKPSGYSMASFEEQVIPAFCNGNATPEEPYSKLVGLNSLSFRDCAQEPSGSCAEIVILDQPIAHNPEIDGAVEGLSGAQPTGQETLCTDPQTLGIARFHSTHMAGIIVSKKNDKAFIGLHPSARLVQGWADDGEIANRVQARRNRDAMQVYLYARSWKLGPPFAAGDRLIKPESRTENIVAKRIHNLQENLWIVAAGQPSKEGLLTVSEIDGHLNLGPMNSGDQENVLVVSGCTECGSGAARLWNQGHFSKQFVHVAAPADLIVSTATAGSFTWAQGTSQAAAFVAGVVSALVSDWPTSYKFASRVKERLQYTATPFPDAADREKLAAGIINPDLALRDPNKDFIDLTDLTGPLKDLEPVVIEGWCDGSLTVLTPQGNLVKDGYIYTSRVHRIVQVGSGQRRQWSIFADNAWGDQQPGVIMHIGPGIPTVQGTGATDARPFLKLGPTKPGEGGRIITLQQIENLLIHADLPKVSCS